MKGNASSIDPASLGTPLASWGSDGCDVTQFFEPQTLIFDISLCGGKPFPSLPSSLHLNLIISFHSADYAGNGNSFYQTCTGVCYQDWVLGDPSNFDTAYFEVSYVRVYGTPGELTVINSGALPSMRLGRATGLLGMVVAFVSLALFTLL